MTLEPCETISNSQGPLAAERRQTFGVVDHVDQVSPAGLGRVQDALHQPHAPHALRHRVAVAQPTGPGELRRDGGEQHGAVILRRDLDGLVVLVLRHPDILRHLRWESLKYRTGGEKRA